MPEGMRRSRAQVCQGQASLEAVLQLFGVLSSATKAGLA
jgi:hypothetical protein